MTRPIKRRGLCQYHDNVCLALPNSLLNFLSHRRMVTGLYANTIEYRKIKKPNSTYIMIIYKSQLSYQETKIHDTFVQIVGSQPDQKYSSSSTAGSNVH